MRLSFHVYSFVAITAVMSATINPTAPKAISNFLRPMQSPPL